MPNQRELLLELVHSVAPKSEREINPEVLIQRIKSVVEKMNADLKRLYDDNPQLSESIKSNFFTVEEGDEMHYRGNTPRLVRGSGSTKKIVVKFAEQPIAEFNLTTRKSVTGKHSVGIKELSEQEIEDRINTNIRKLISWKSPQ